MDDRDLASYAAIVGEGCMDTAADPPLIVPPDEHSLCIVLRKAASDRVSIIVTGGGSLPLPRLPGPVLRLSTAGLAQVPEVSPDDMLVRVQAGTRVDNAVRASAEHGLLFPLEVFDGEKATVGGAYCAGAIGPDARPSGGFADTVIGVRVATMTGEIVAGGGRTRKNVTGYDLPRFFAGTMGLFGVVTELTVPVRRMPPVRIVVSAHIPAERPIVPLAMSARDTVPGVSLLLLTAPSGLAGDTAVGIGVDGVEATVDDAITRLYELLDRKDARGMTTVSRIGYLRDLRRAVMPVIGADPLVMTIPPAAMAVVSGKIRALAGDAPVVLEPGIGRIRLACTDVRKTGMIRDAVLAVGGSYLVRWSAAAGEGLAERYTGEEWVQIRALKRELDPTDTLNPHLMR